MDDLIAGDVSRDRIEDYGRPSRSGRGWSVGRIVLYVWLGLNAVFGIVSLILVPAARVFTILWLLLWAGILWRDATGAAR